MAITVLYELLRGTDDPFGQSGGGRHVAVQVGDVRVHAALLLAVSQLGGPAEFHIGGCGRRHCFRDGWQNNSARRIVALKFEEYLVDNT